MRFTRLQPRKGSVTIPPEVLTGIYNIATDAERPPVDDLLVMLALGRKGVPTTLSPYGEALAKLIPSRPGKTNGKSFRLIDVLSVMPPTVKAWLGSEPPLVDQYGGGPLFSYLGVLNPIPGTSDESGRPRYALSTTAAKAMLLLNGGNLVEAKTLDAMNDAFTDEQQAILDRLRGANFSKPGQFDGRALRGLFKTGLVELAPLDDKNIRMVPAMQNFVALCLDRSADSMFQLFQTLPPDDRSWIMTEMAYPTDCPRAAVYRRMGWVTLASKGKWYLSPIGRELSDLAWKADADALIDPTHDAHAVELGPVDSSDEFDILGPSEAASAEDTSQEAWDII